jgi:hypothetical protein
MIQLGISVSISYAFIHYLDSKIWRVRRDASVGKRVEYVIRSGVRTTNLRITVLVSPHSDPQVLPPHSQTKDSRRVVALFTANAD